MIGRALGRLSLSKGEGEGEGCPKANSFGPLIFILSAFESEEAISACRRHKTPASLKLK